jgi:hypothetical protein
MIAAMKGRQENWGARMPMFSHLASTPRIIVIGEFDARGGQPDLCKPLRTFCAAPGKPGMEKRGDPRRRSFAQAVVV